MAKRKATEPAQKASRGATQSPQDVVDHIRQWLVTASLKPGDRLPAERELAATLRISRGGIRRAFGYLAALGIIEVRHGIGAFLAKTPTGLGEAPLQVLRATGALQSRHLFEARRALEVTIAGLAAERCREDQLAPIAEELAEMFATAEDPEAFLIHDIRFHRAVAQACGNPILASLMESIAGGLYEERRVRVGTAANRQSTLVAHRKLYHAVRRRDAVAARAAMETHLAAAAAAQH